MDTTSNIDYSKINHYLAIIDAGHDCGSWATDKIAFAAIERVIHIAKSDWHLTGKGYVHVYDLTHADTFSTGSVPRNSETKQPLPYLYSVAIDLPAGKTRKVSKR